MANEDQAEIIHFLSDPAAYGEPGPVEVVHTHISAVFLVGGRAFKLKKAVLFPYLDFSTPELRRRLCEVEVAVNRRTAPDLYRRVVPVTRAADGGLAIDGDGDPVDWLVEMARFPSEMTLDRVLAREGRLKRPLLEAMAAAVAAFHAKAEVRPDRGGYQGLRYIVDNNAECFQSWGGGVFDPALVERINSDGRALVDGLRGLLEARRAAGRVRHCHGDLHLRNIALIDETPTPFDAIEFSDAIACIDTLYDLAFLLMDLDFRGDRLGASMVFNRYMDITGDVEGLAALPLMLSLRAGVRAHVGLAAAQGTADAAREAALAEARRYLDFAYGYLHPPRPRLVAVGGLSGSGKSRLARELSPRVGAAPGALVPRSDAIRKRLAGVGPLERLAPEFYGAEMTVRTFDTLYAEARAALAAGHSVIADAVFARPEQRAAIEAVAREVGVPFTGLWAEAPAEVMAARIRKRTANASDATEEVLRMQLGYDLGNIGWHRIDSGGSKRRTVAAALAVLGLEGSS